MTGLAKENIMNGYLLLMQFEKLDVSSFIFFSQKLQGGYKNIINETQSKMTNNYMIYEYGHFDNVLIIIFNHPTWLKYYFCACMFLTLNIH